MSDDWPGQPVEMWPGQPVAAQNVEPADHGRSERASNTTFGTGRLAREAGAALTPITGYVPTYQRMRGEAYNQAGEGLHQMAHPSGTTLSEGLGLDKLQNIYREGLGLPEQPSEKNGTGMYDVGAGALKTAAGGFNYLLGSPFNAAYRSIIGQPLEDTTGIPREYPEFAAQLATPGIGFGKLPTAPGTVADASAVARAVGRPGEVAGVADGAAPKIRALEGPDLNTPEAQANRALLDEFQIPGTRGQVTEDADAIRFEDMAARGASGKEMQDIAQPAFEDQYKAIQDAGQRIGQQVNRGEGPLNAPADAASSVSNEIAGRAQSAREARDAEVTAAGRDEQALRAAHAEQGQTIGEAISEAHGEIENPRAAGEIVNRDVRGKAAAHRADFRAKYDEFGNMEGEVEGSAVERLGKKLKRVVSDGDDAVDIDDLTPAAQKVVKKLNSMTKAEEGEELGGVSLKEVDRMRRHLVNAYKSTQRGSEDQRAVRSLMKAFDDHIESVVTDGLFSGDPKALEVLQSARASYARYRQTYHPQQNDGGIGEAMRRIVERNATAEETANLIVGSGKIGQAGLPVRIADRLETVLGKDSEAWNSIRQAIWQKASRVTNARGDIDAARSSQAIRELSGSSLGKRMFSPEELTAMRNHAQASRDLEGVVAVRSTARAERAQATFEQAFGTGELTGKQKQVFNRMIDGTAQPEEVSEALFSVIAGGNPADASRAISAVERIVGKDSPVMGNVRQGVWQKLTQHPFGKDQPGQQKLVQSINEFLNGKGRSISHQLYTAEERATMQRYADAVRKTIIGKYSRTNSDTAVAQAAHAQKQVAQVASVINSFLHTGPLGHIGGSWVAKKIGEKVGAAAQAKSAQALRDSVTDTVPAQPGRVRGKPPRAPSAIKPFAIPRPQSRDERNQTR